MIIFIILQVTRYFGPTGSEYMFIIFNGVLRCLSLTTGQPVVKVGQVKTHFASNNDDDDEEEEEEDEEDDDDEKGSRIYLSLSLFLRLFKFALSVRKLCNKAGKVGVFMSFEYTSSYLIYLFNGEL